MSIRQMSDDIMNDEVLLMVHPVTELQRLLTPDETGLKWPDMTIDVKRILLY